MAADLGFQDGIDFAWPSYIPESDKEKAETALTQTQALNAILANLQSSVAANFLTEDQAKERYELALERLGVN